MLTVTRLSVAEARILIDGATKKSDEMGMPMCIAVVDESGHLIAFDRMDGGKVSSISIAIDKAFTGAVARKPSHVYGELCQPGKPTYGIHMTNQGHFCIIGGGIPGDGRRRDRRRHRPQLRHRHRGYGGRRGRHRLFPRDDGPQAMIGSTVLFSEMRPAPEWEDRFNTWYHEDHIPVRMVLDGWQGAQRYTSADDEDYLVIYDMTSPAVLKTPEYETIKTDPSDETKWMLATCRTSPATSGRSLGGTAISTPPSPRR
jgi:uncharacterized protein GlcG (DUF336 family)